MSKQSILWRLWKSLVVQSVTEARTEKPGLESWICYTWSRQIYNWSCNLQNEGFSSSYTLFGLGMDHSWVYAGRLLAVVFREYHIEHPACKVCAQPFNLSDPLYVSMHASMCVCMHICVPSLHNQYSAVLELLLGLLGWDLWSVGWKAAESHPIKRQQCSGSQVVLASNYQHQSYIFKCYFYFYYKTMSIVNYFKVRK